MKKYREIIFNNYNPYMKYFVYFYDDDNIYFEIIETIFKEFNYYNIVYILQFKFIENELKELGKMKVKSEKLLHWKRIKNINS